MSISISTSTHSGNACVENLLLDKNDSCLPEFTIHRAFVHYYKVDFSLKDRTITIPNKKFTYYLKKFMKNEMRKNE